MEAVIQIVSFDLIRFKLVELLSRLFHQPVDIDCKPHTINNTVREKHIQQISTIFIALHVQERVRTNAAIDYIV